MDTFYFIKDKKSSPPAKLSVRTTETIPTIPPSLLKEIVSLYQHWKKKIYITMKENHRRKLVDKIVPEESLLK